MTQAAGCVRLSAHFVSVILMQLGIVSQADQKIIRGTFLLVLLHFIGSCLQHNLPQPFFALLVESAGFLVVRRLHSSLPLRPSLW